MNSTVINGYRINAFPSKELFLNYIQNEKKILIAMNAEKISKNDDKLRSIINRHISYSDGVGAVMALKKSGLDAVKIAGSEFWLDIIKRFQNSKTFYFVGSTTIVIESTIKKLKQTFPELQILGYRNGFLKKDDKKRLIEDLKEKQPDIVFVAQGSPRQELLMDELHQIHPALYMGLGGSFDIYGGDKKRAPQLFLNYHLEWLYRLLKEPTRIGRQLTLVKFFIFHLLLSNIIK